MRPAPPVLTLVLILLVAMPPVLPSERVGPSMARGRAGTPGTGAVRPTLASAVDAAPARAGRPGRALQPYVVGDVHLVSGLNGSWDPQAARLDAIARGVDVAWFADAYAPWSELGGYRVGWNGIHEYAAGGAVTAVKTYLADVAGSSDPRIVTYMGTEVSSHQWWRYESGRPSRVWNVNRTLLILGLDDDWAFTNVPCPANPTSSYPISTSPPSPPTAPWQETIDWVNDAYNVMPGREAVVIWAQPEIAQEVLWGGGITLSTDPHHQDLLATTGWDAFEAVRGGAWANATIAPGGTWDQALAEYLDGTRDRPGYAVGGSGGGGPGYTVFMVPGIADATFGAIKAGKVYAADAPDLLSLVDWKVRDPYDLSGVPDEASSGDWVECDHHPQIIVNLSAEHGVARLRVIREGVVVNETSGSGIWHALEFEDAHFDPLGSTYYRVEAEDHLGNRVVSNPVFVRYRVHAQLRAGAPFASPAAPVEGEAVEIALDVYNDAGIEVPRFTVALEMDGVECGRTVAAVGPLGIARVRIPWIAKAGEHLLTVRVDPDDRVKEDNEADNLGNLTLRVNDIPRAVLAAPTRVLSLEPAVFDASASEDSDIALYRFDFGDGEVTEWSSSPTAAHAYARPGYYTARARIRDADGLESEWSDGVEVEVMNRPPSARLDPSEVESLSLVEVRFTLVAIDPDGTVASVRWSWGDGNASTGERAAHAYARPGNYTVRVRVEDNNGSSNETSARVYVLNRPPEVTFDTPGPALAGSPLAFRAVAVDPDGGVASVEWEFGDGGTAAGTVASHVYTVPGNYTVVATAEDVNGSTASWTGTVRVLNRPPEVGFVWGPEGALTGETVTFNASSSFDPDGLPLAFSWSFGDNSTADTETAAHAYARPGNYTVTLTVRDAHGGTAAAEATVEVGNRAPTLSCHLTPRGTVRQKVSLVVEASDSDGSVARMDVVWGDGTYETGDGFAFLHAYAAPGRYTVRVRAVDDLGARSAEWIAVVEIENPEAATESGERVDGGDGGSEGVPRSWALALAGGLALLATAILAAALLLRRSKGSRSEEEASEFAIPGPYPGYETPLLPVEEAMRGRYRENIGIPVQPPSYAPPVARPTGRVMTGSGPATRVRALAGPMGGAASGRPPERRAPRGAPVAMKPGVMDLTRGVRPPGPA